MYVKFELEVRDYGCGISKEQLNSLFMNFRTLDEHKMQNPNGKGLGLSICK